MIYDVQYRLSGGSSNSDPLASLGGAMSSHGVYAQTATVVDAIAGVTRLGGYGNNLGDGEITYDMPVSTATFKWTDFGSTGTTSITVTSDGTYAIPSPDTEGVLWISVVHASLPTVASPTQYTTTIAAATETLFPTINALQSEAGQIDYRWIYILNTGAATLTLSVYIATVPTGPEVISIALDPSGKNHAPSALANAYTKPSGVTFSTPITEGTALSLGSMATNDYYALAVRRKLTGGTITPYLGETFKLTLVAA